MDHKKKKPKRKIAQHLVTVNYQFNKQTLTKFLLKSYNFNIGFVR